MGLLSLLPENFTLTIVHRTDKLIASSVYDIHKRVSSIPHSPGRPFIVVIFLPALYYSQSCSFSKLPGSQGSFMHAWVSRNKPWFRGLDFSISAGLVHSSPPGTPSSLKWESHSVMADVKFSWESHLMRTKDQIQSCIRWHLPLYFWLVLKRASVSLFTVTCPVKRGACQKPCLN